MSMMLHRLGVMSFKKGHNEDLLTGLLGNWKFNGNLLDSSGNGRHATIVQGVENYGQGINGQAFDANGATRAEVPHDSALRLLSAYTISFRIKLRSITQNFTRPICKHTNLGWEIHTSTQSLLIRHDDVTTNRLAAPGIILDNWSFWNFSYDGDALKIYVDGALVNTASGVTSPSSNTIPLSIFGRQAISRFIDGYMQDLTIYDRALTDGQIDALYNFGVPT